MQNPRWSRTNLLLRGLVGHFDVGETFSTARRVGHARDLQETFPLHGGNEGSRGVPRSCSHLGLKRQNRSESGKIPCGTPALQSESVPRRQSSSGSPPRSPPLGRRRTSHRSQRPEQTEERHGNRVLTRVYDYGSIRERTAQLPSASALPLTCCNRHSTALETPRPGFPLLWVI